MATLSQRNPRKPRKLDRDAAIAASQRGLTDSQIAQQQGVHPSTVFRFLEQIRSHSQQITHFRAKRADVLTHLQSKAIDTIDLVLEDLRKEGVIAAMPPSAKASILNVLNNVAGTAYDKERLETGQSTANHAVLHKVMDAAFKSVLKPTAVPASVEPMPREPIAQEERPGAGGNGVVE